MLFVHVSCQSNVWLANFVFEFILQERLVR